MACLWKNLALVALVIVVIATTVIAFELSLFRTGKGIPGAMKSGLGSKRRWNSIRLVDEVLVLRDNRADDHAMSLLHGYFKRLSLIGGGILIGAILLGIMNM